MSQINEKVVEIIVEKLNCEASEVTPEANFSSDLGAGEVCCRGYFASFAGVLFDDDFGYRCVDL